MYLVGYAKQNTYPTMTENGKTYYLYTVQKSEGLYAISQRFSVPQSLIIEANPGVEQGLKLGQQIKVPQNSHATNKKNTKAIKVGKDQHVVKAKETLYGLSKKYNCTIDELLELNPWATHLTIGSVLQIPTKDVEGQKSKVESQCKPSAETSSLDYAEAQPDFMSEANKVGIYNMRFVKPLDEETLHHICQTYKRIITVEDGVLQGGFGSAVLEFMADNGYNLPVKRIGIPNQFVEHGSPAELYHMLGMDAEGIAKAIEG